MRNGMSIHHGIFGFLYKHERGQTIRVFEAKAYYRNTENRMELPKKFTDLLRQKYWKFRDVKFKTLFKNVDLTGLEFTVAYKILDEIDGAEWRIWAIAICHPKYDEFRKRVGSNIVKNRIKERLNNVFDRDYIFVEHPKGN